MSKARREPRLVPYVLQAILDCNDNRGSNLQDIVEQVEATQAAFGKSLKNLEAQVTQALKYGVEAGLIKIRQGKYKMSSTGGSKRQRLESPAHKSSNQCAECRSRKLRRKADKHSSLIRSKDNDENDNVLSGSDWSIPSRDMSMARSRSRRRRRNKRSRSRRRRRRSSHRRHSASSSRGEGMDHNWESPCEEMDGPLMRREGTHPRDPRRKRICDYEDCDSPCCILPNYRSMQNDDYAPNEDKSESYIN